VREAKNQLGLQKGALEKGVIPELEKLEELIRGITRTAEVITLETERLSQAEAERVKLKFTHKIKEPLKVEKTFFQKLKEKFSGCFSANDIELKPKTIEMVSVLHSKAQDNEIPVDPIGVDAPIIDPEGL
jgi:ubiquinone biosynthesis protein COQ9